jgi:hypothetical protein
VCVNPASTNSTASVWPVDQAVKAAPVLLPVTLVQQAHPQLAMAPAPAALALSWFPSQPVCTASPATSTAPPAQLPPPTVLLARPVSQSHPPPTPVSATPAPSSLPTAPSASHVSATVLAALTPHTAPTVHPVTSTTAQSSSAPSTVPMASSTPAPSASPVQLAASAATPNKSVPLVSLVTACSPDPAAPTVPKEPTH